MTVGGGSRDDNTTGASIALRQNAASVLLSSESAVTAVNNLHGFRWQIIAAKSFTAAVVSVDLRSQLSMTENTALLNASAVPGVSSISSTHLLGCELTSLLDLNVAFRMFIGIDGRDALVLLSGNAVTAVGGAALSVNYAAGSRVEGFLSIVASDAAKLRLNQNSGTVSAGKTDSIVIGAVVISRAGDMFRLSGCAQFFAGGNSVDADVDAAMGVVSGFYMGLAKITVDFSAPAVEGCHAVSSGKAMEVHAHHYHH